MSNDTVRVTHEVPEEVRDAAQDATERGELSEAVRRVYRAIAFGETYDDFERVEAELAMLEAEERRAEAKREDADAYLREIRDRREALHEKRERSEDRSAGYEEALARIEQDVRDGMRVFPDHGSVTQAAKTAGKDPEEVLADLRARNPSLPDRAFEDASESDHVWRGVDR